MGKRACRFMVMVVLAVSCVLMGAISAFAADTVPNDWYQAQGPLQPAVKKLGSLETAGDADWYYFYNGAAGQVKIGFNTSNGADLIVYRLDGGYLNRVYSGWNSGLIDAVMQPGLYYVKLTDSSIGTYDFTVSGTFVSASVPGGVQAHPGFEKKVEDNTVHWTSAQGPVLPAVTQVSEIHSSGDADWYYFYNGAAGQVRVGFNSSNGADLIVYRWDGGYLNRVYSDWSYGLIDAVMQPGLYYVKLTDSSIGTYDFTVSGTFVSASVPGGVQAHPAAVPVLENNNNETSGAYGPMIANAPHTSRIEAAGDVDWYYFYNGAAGQVKVGFNSSNGADLVLYRLDGGYLNQVDSEWSYGLIDAVMNPGLYYVKVTDSSAGSYDVTVGGTFIASTPPVKPLPKASLTRPSAPKTVRRSKSFTVTGYLKPRHKAGTFPVRIKCYRYSSASGKYVYKKTVKAKAYNYSTYTKYRVTTSLGSKGKWKLKAVHPADSKRAYTVSASRYLTVK